MKNQRIGQIFLSPSHFQDAAAKTMGQPALSDEVISNRRAVRGKLNEKGKQALERIAAEFERRFDVHVTFKWSLKAGCSMCPCSPGFNAYIAVPEGQLFVSRLREEERVDVWVADDGSFRMDPAQYGRFAKEKAQQPAPQGMSKEALVADLTAMAKGAVPSERIAQLAQAVVDGKIALRDAELQVQDARKMKLVETLAQRVADAAEEELADLLNQETGDLDPDDVMELAFEVQRKAADKLNGKE